jgi:hypothetical protein
MNTTRPELASLLDDPICRLLMSRDGVRPLDVLRMMRNLRPVVGHGRGVARNQDQTMAA